MRVQIIKRADGAGLLQCIRNDGSSVWQKQSERHATHFALHDLTHFAVETTLGYKNGFFGLVEQGWEMDDITGKGSQGKLPVEAIEVESIVGLFDAERACARVSIEENVRDRDWTSEEFNAFAKIRAEQGEPMRMLMEEEIARIRACRTELFQRWTSVKIGEKLSLEF